MSIKARIIFACSRKYFYLCELQAVVTFPNMIRFLEENINYNVLFQHSSVEHVLQGKDDVLLLKYAPSES